MTTQGALGEPDFDRFARFVKARRAVLNLAQDQTQMIGGPSDTTFSKIENKTWRPGRTATLKKVDRGLMWEEGSSARILWEGGDPVPLPTSAAPAPPTSELADRSDIDMAVELSVLLESANSAVWALVRKLPDDEHGRQAVNDLSAARYVAEKLALSLAGDEFPLLRQQVRARIGEHTPDGAPTNGTAPVPAQLAEMAGQAPLSDEKWRLERPSEEDLRNVLETLEGGESGS